MAKKCVLDSLFFIRCFFWCAVLQVCFLFVFANEHQICLFQCVCELRVPVFVYLSVCQSHIYIFFSHQFTLRRVCECVGLRTAKEKTTTKIVIQIKWVNKNDYNEGNAHTLSKKNNKQHDRRVWMCLHYKFNKWNWWWWCDNDDEMTCTLSTLLFLFQCYHRYFNDTWMMCWGLEPPTDNSCYMLYLLSLACLPALYTK